MVRILVLMPVHQSGLTLPRVLDALRGLDPQPDGFVFAENNSTDESLRLLAGFPQPREIIRFWVRGDVFADPARPYEAFAAAMQFLLRRARRVDPDYAVFLDADIVPLQRDFLARLTRWDGENVQITEIVPVLNHVLRSRGPAPAIVGGPFERSNPDGRLMTAAMWPGSTGRVAKCGLPLFRRAMKRLGIVLERVRAVASGCMCLNRQVLQDRRLNFYPAVFEAPDLRFGGQADDLGYSACLDWSIELEHLELNKNRPWRRVAEQFFDVKD